MGCYPVFSCADWSRLHLDLAELSPDLVSLVLVTDPFGEFEPRDLPNCFPDLVAPFKEHFVVDLRRPLSLPATDHHRRNLRKALGAVAVELVDQPAELGDEWVRLYHQLIARHEISGLAAFSPAALARQLQVPGMVALRASRGDETVGVTLWCVQGEVGYYHLGAYSEEGYRWRASFALFWRAIESFAERGLRWLSLGAGAGLEANPADGLSRFKRGWATGTRTVYLCGRVYDSERYAALTAANGTQGASFFPAYRAPRSQTEASLRR
jgi:hypothetical protein